MRSLFPFAALCSIAILCGCNSGDQKMVNNNEPKTENTVGKDSTNKSIYIVELSEDYVQQNLKALGTNTDSLSLQKSYRRDFLAGLGLDESDSVIVEALRYVFYAKLNDSQVQTLLKDHRIDTVRPYKLVPHKFLTPINCTPSTELQWNVQAVWKASHPNGSYKSAWILDTGVDPKHGDLNVTLNVCYIAGAQSVDVHGHGTHIAGIIGAKANAKGVIGVAPNASLKCFKIYTDNTDLDPKAYHKSLDYVLQNAIEGDVLNLSISGEGSDATEKKYITAIAAKKIYVVIAAGNTKQDVENKIYPACINGTNIYTVSASDKTMTYSSFSNWGGVSVDYSAPGEDVCSTWKGGGYMSESGTSQAAAHLSGLLLLTKGKVASLNKVKKDPDGTVDPIIHE